MKPDKNCFIKEYDVIYIYIFVEFSFLNGLQKSTDRIFRLAVPALLAATGHIL
jgi:hypothetical protein